MDPLYRSAGNTCNVRVPCNEYTMMMMMMIKQQVYNAHKMEEQMRKKIEKLNKILYHEIPNVNTRMHSFISNRMKCNEMINSYGL